MVETVRVRQCQIYPPTNQQTHNTHAITPIQVGCPDRMETIVVYSNSTPKLIRQMEQVTQQFVRGLPSRVPPSVAWGICISLSLAL